MKERLDVLLVKRNLAASREKAKAIIMSGNVYVDNQKEDKPGTTFPEESKIEVRGHTLPYVSRGGLKLEKAMKEEMTKNELQLFVLAITDILNSNSEIIALGDNAEDIIEKAFNKKLEENRAFLEGVVSRKKQLLPNIDKNI